jgi:hypothetical protein
MTTIEIVTNVYPDAKIQRNLKTGKWEVYVPDIVSGTFIMSAATTHSKAWRDAASVINDFQMRSRQKTIKYESIRL